MGRNAEKTARIRFVDQLLSWSQLSLEVAMSIVHTSRMTIRKHDGPHRTAWIDNFEEPLNFGIHGGIAHFYRDKYGRELPETEYPATLDHIIAGVAG